MGQATVFKINSPKVTYEIFDDEVVMINLDSGNYYSLDKAGITIWSALQRNATPAEVVAEVFQQYERDSGDDENAVIETVRRLAEEDLIVPIPENEVQEARTVPGLEPPANKLPFMAPILQTYTDMQELLLLDPIHEVDEMGWPHAKTGQANG